MQYLPKNCKPNLIIRDKARFYNGTKVKLIMAGWHPLLYSLNISPKINPFFISYHLNDTDKLPSIYVENMKKYSSISCRDLKTRDQFISYGIKAYFSSCLIQNLILILPLMKKKEQTKSFLLIINLAFLIKRINSLNHLHLIILVILHKT